MTCARQGQGTTTSRCSIGRAGIMATGRQITLSASATSANQDPHHTSAGIRLQPETKPDEMTGGKTIGGTRTGTAMTGNARTKGGNVFRLHHQGMNTRTRMPPTSCSSASATTSEAGASDSRR